MKNFQNNLLRGMLAVGAIIFLFLAGALIAAAESGSLNQPTGNSPSPVAETPDHQTVFSSSTCTPTDKPLPTTTLVITVTPSLSCTNTLTSTPTACPYPQDWQSYTVKAKDTLTSLANKHKISVAELLQSNCLQDPANLTVGTIIFLPRLKIENPTQPLDTLPTVLPVPISTVSG